jgi:hypothetical protein
MMQRIFLMVLFCMFICSFAQGSLFNVSTETTEGAKASISKAVASEASEAKGSSGSGPTKKSVFTKMAETIKKTIASAKNAIKDGTSTVKGKAEAKIDNIFDKKPKFVAKSYKIPGHDDKKFVCQGITYLGDGVVSSASAQKNQASYPYTVLSFYPTKNTTKPSQLVVLNATTGKPLCRFDLYQSESKAYRGHAGGITLAGEFIWVASGNKIYGFDTKTIIDFIKEDTAKKPATTPTGIPKSLNLPHKKLVAKVIYETDSKASFVSFDGKYLWVGDFVKSSNKSYAPIAHHKSKLFNRSTWISGYLTDSKGMPTSKTLYEYKVGDSMKKGYKPDAVICCRESVQGMSVCDDYIALSISYGAANSKLAFYKNPLNEKGTTISYRPEGQSKTYKTIGYELSDAKNWAETVALAAGSEDIDYDGKYLYVSFEGASPNYKPRWSLNPAVNIEEDYYLIDIDKILY